MGNRVAERGRRPVEKRVESFVEENRLIPRGSRVVRIPSLNITSSESLAGANW